MYLSITRYLLEEYLSEKKRKRKLNKQQKIQNIRKIHFDNKHFQMYLSITKYLSEEYFC